MILQIELRILAALSDTLFDRADAAHVEPHRSVELEGPAPGGGLGVAEHDPDLLAQLIDEDHGGAGAVDRPGELAERLAHEARLQAGERIPHVPLDLRLGYEGGH